MKKLFVMTLAVAALASCSKVEPIEPGHKSAIGFGNAFIDNATKAELTTSTIANFAVWGTENGASIFDGDDVIKGNTTQGGTWGYTGTKYWHPGNDYKFAAIAPADHGGTVYTSAGLPTSITYTLDPGNIGGQVDLLYAIANASTIAPSVAPDTVKFTFKHLLSKVQFTFTNGHATGSNYNVIVKDVIIKANPNSTVTLAGDSGTWDAPTGTAVDLSFPTFNNGAAFGPQAKGVSKDQSLIIPNTDVDYNVTGTAEIYVGTTKVETRTINGKIDANSFAPGVFYNVTAEINSTNKIIFSVKEVTGWSSPAGDTTLNQN